MESIVDESPFLRAIRRFSEEYALTKTRLLVLLLVPLWLWPVPVIADEARWEQHMRAGMAAYQRSDETKIENYEEAVSQTRAALKEAEDFGEQDPRLAFTLRFLAAVYHRQGFYELAEPLYERSLAIYEKALGAEHPQVAITLSILAQLWSSPVQGRYAEAEPLYKRSLVIREKALGPEHPDVATSLNSLANLYSAQDRYAEAEPLYKRAITIYEKALGPEHWALSNTLDELANLYRAQGRNEEAVRLLREHGQ